MKPASMAGPLSRIAAVIIDLLDPPGEFPILENAASLG